MDVGFTKSITCVNLMMKLNVCFLSSRLAPWLLFGVLQASNTSADVSTDDFVDMSLADLIELEVFEASSRLPTPVNETPGTTYSFNQEDFKRYGVRRLDDLLQYVPGFQINQSRKRHRSIWARGMLQRYNEKLILLVDGVRQQHLYYGHFSLGDEFPLERIEKVEIIQGPASSLYGANAFSGLIAITTKDFSPQTTTILTLEGADNNRSKITGVYNSEKIQVFASSLDQDAPFNDERNSFIGTPALQPLAEDYQSLNIKVQPSTGLTLSVDYSSSQTPFLFIPQNQDAFVESEHLNGSITYQRGDLETGKLEFNAFYQQDEGYEFELEQVTQSLGYQEHQDSILGGATATVFKSFDAHTLVGGLSWRYEHAKDMSYERRFHYASGFLAVPETGSLISEPGIENNDYAVFLQDVWALNDTTTLTLGGRHDDFERFGDYYNYRAALVYTAQLQHTWKLLYGTAIRTPTLREYAKVLEGTTFLPPDLNAEGIETIELGYLYRQGKLSLDVTVFSNALKDTIYERPTPDGFDEYYANSTHNRRLHGFESLLKYQPSPDIELNVSAAYVDDSVNADDVSELPYIAHWSGSTSINYAFLPQHTVGLSFVYNSDRRDTNSYSDDSATGFVTTNINVTGKLSSTLEYQFGVDNVFDRKIFDPAADFGNQYNNEQSVREIWLGLTWTPKFL